MTALGSRYRRSSRRRDTKSPRKVLLQAGITTAVVVVLAVLALSIYGGAPWNHYKTMYVSAPDTGNLQPHDPVKIGGIRVGQVKAVGVTAGGEARLQLQLASNTKLPTGTTFAIRANGLLGSRYVQLIPGHGSQELPVGTDLKGNVDSLTLGVPDALNVLNQQTRGNLAKLINGLGEGLLGRGAGLNDDTHLVSIDQIPAQQVITALLGSDLQRLIPSLDSLTIPLDEARVQITDVLAPLAKGLEPFVTQRAAVQDTLADAPSALVAATAGLGNGQRLLTAADSLAKAAADVLPQAPGGLKQATLLLSQSHPALAKARTLLVDAKPAIPAALKITSAARPLLRPLSAGLDNAIPIATQLSPYGCNIENAAATINSMTGMGGTEPGGPGGTAMAFRLELDLAPPTEILGTKDYTGIVQRNGYAPPCTYLSTTYPTSTAPTGGVGG